MTVPAEPAPSSALALPAELHRRATDVATICKQIVVSTSVPIQGKNYVKVEGWMSIATAHGCTASARDVEKVEGGVRAIGEIRRIDTGHVIATAEGFVGEDEPVWFGGVVQTGRGPKTYEKRPNYAIRAMAQTRAISRACRTAFAHVVVMMDAGLSTTPAEEVPYGGFNDDKAEPKAVAAEPSGAPGTPGTWQGIIVPKFIKKFAGMTLGAMAKESPKDTIWWADHYEPKGYQGNPPTKADYDLQAALLEAKAQVCEDPLFQK